MIRNVKSNLKGRRSSDKLQWLRLEHAMTSGNIGTYVYNPHFEYAHYFIHKLKVNVNVVLENRILFYHILARNIIVLIIKMIIGCDFWGCRNSVS